MTSDIFQKKQIILKRLINSGINITPSVLDFILTTDKPLNNLDLIIKETSFIPTFKSHLTIDTITKISDENIQNSLKIIINQETKENQQRKDKSSLDSEKELSKEKDPSLLFNNIKPEKLIIKSELKGKAPAIKKEDLSLNSNNYKIIDESHKKKIKKNKEIDRKISKLESSKIKLKFNPLAKEFDSEFKIKKDPSGKIHTSGDYNDFYSLTCDKYKRLSKLILRRPEAQSSLDINNIHKIKDSSDVSIVGLVTDIRTTKNGHYFITLEDLTGSINIIVKKDADNRENMRLAERTIDDQFLFVKGNFNPGKNGRSGIVFADTISKIDIPIGLKPQTSPDPLSIVLLSDIHIGSREFEEKLWNKFISFLKGEINNNKIRKSAEKIKYVVVNGDLVDGIGIYPNQEKDLVITDIYRQYKKAAELISQIPDYIQVFYSCGNHEPVRNAIPRPAVPKKYSQELLDIGVKVLGNPCYIQTHNVDTLVYHGDSLIDLNFLIPGLDNNKSADTMKELLICRHLAPSFGKKTQIAPISKDWLVIDDIPQIFHTGHIHINDYGTYRGVKLVNSGCFQSQTDFMKSFGIEPTPGILPIIELDTLDFFELDLKKVN
ncbi:MAG: DNA-directed DNA polymerase II small subunit [Candidatus Lokiarchaeota archaeon]|nr:DNA-directed DNA polymerase II small subunit [Candidatus Lokiarchaeota archaeon]